MAAPTNLSAATAVELGPLPNSISQRVDDAGTTYTVWYKFTSASEQTIGLWAFGDLTTYAPRTFVYGSDGVTEILNGGLNSSANKRLEFPVGVGTYYFKIDKVFGDPSPANLTISGLPAPTDAIAAGNILVNDDLEGMPGCVMTTAGVVSQFILGMANGEAGAILPSGRYLLTRDDETGANNGKANIYNADSTLAATVTINAATDNFKLMKAGASDTYFYVLDRSLTPAVVNQITFGGSTVTSWEIPGTFLETSAIAPSRDDAILYYVASSQTVIKRWDLVNDIALSDLYTYGANTKFVSDLLVLSGGSLLAGLETTDTLQYSVLNLSAAGSVLHTFNVNAVGLLNRLALNVADTALSFWFWSFTRIGDFSQSVFEELKISDGSVLQTTGDVMPYESGQYVGTATATPTANFGPSTSCPFLILRSSGAPPFTVTTYPVRRLRQSPHLSDKQLWQFFSLFQLDLQAGVGLSDGSNVATDPQIMLSYSDDGGHTWSSERWISAGKIGEYTHRAIWRRLGRSRDRVWRVVVDAPVAWRFLQAFAAVEEGTS